MKLSRRQLLLGLGAFGAGWFAGNKSNDLTSTIRSIRRRVSKGVFSRYDIKPRRNPVITNAQEQTEPFGFKAPPIEMVRIGVIGVGSRGNTLARLLAKIDNVMLTAICDLRPEKINKVEAHLKKETNYKPIKQFYGNRDAYHSLLALDLDLVVIATPWEEHAVMVLNTLKADKHVVVELPVCTKVDEAWQILETARKAKKHCMMLENCCYGEAEQTLLNMCRNGVLGDIVHAEAAYIHDLIESTFNPNRHFPKFWRLNHHKKRNGCLYPSHGLGPVSKYMGIFQTDAMSSLISMSGPSVGYKEYSKDAFGPIRQGDMNVTLIRTESGRIIEVQFNTSNPRPYSRDNTVVGTRGTFRGFPDRLAILPDASSFNPDAWEAALEMYRSELWHKHGDYAKNEIGIFGHGGMDYLMLLNLISNLHNGREMDIDIHESLLWSVITPLSEESVALGSTSIPIPDFTKGAWKQRGEVASPFRWESIRT